MAALRKSRQQMASEKLRYENPGNRLQDADARIRENLQTKDS